MKKRTIFLLIVFAALIFSGCDMDLIEKPFVPPVTKPVSPESPEGSYLTVINLPENVRQNHVSDVFVSNQIDRIGFCLSYGEIIIENYADAKALKIPLAYTNTKLKFDETGSYFVSLDINVDASTRFTIRESEKFPLNFINGGAVLDASLIGYVPPAPAPEVSFLTVINLPENVRQNHVSNVFVSNQTNKIGTCLSYDEIIIENYANAKALKIPLAYTNTKLKFDETGPYFVSLDINIDASNRFTIKESEKFSLNFINGGAVLDASIIGYVPPAPAPDVPYLTVTNLPANTQKNHFSGVFVYNSTGVTAKCADYNQIIIIKENNSVTAKIPVSYNAVSEYFKETGTFIVSFTVNIDYATYFIVKESDKLRLYFTDGNAAFDASLIPPPPPPYLTVTSLHRNTKAQSISNVFVYNAAGTAVAKCADYDQIIITRDSFSVTAKIPLYYVSKNEHFIDTGNFIVSLYVNIDFTTQIIVKQDDKLTLFFTEGNAILDASLIPPAPPPPYLTINSLPKNVKPQNFSNVFVYNGMGTASAKCADYNQITISTDSDYASARIPLVYESSGYPYRDSGNFAVSFTLNIDSYIQISKTRDDALYVAFIEGSGTFDFLKNALSGIELGYFSGSLVNPSDTAAPVIRSGTKFEMNGYYYTVNSNTAVVSSSFSNTCIVYVYARLVFSQLEFVYSTTAPSYDSYKKGYYKGLERALYRFVFIRDSANKYFAKTFINDNWEHLRYQIVDADNLASFNLSQHYFLSGMGNPKSHTVSLPAGAYLFTLNGAAGGFAGGISGAQGGHVSEVVILSKSTSFTFFTGERGENGSKFDHEMGSYIGGGGGGSGSFAFSPDGYLLCAGGGGGACPNNSATYSIPCDGGAGGSIGGGGAGGSANEGSAGGNGGGFTGGLGGVLAFNGLRKNGYSDLTIYSYSLGFNGNSLYPPTQANAIGVVDMVKGGSAAFFDLPAPNNWLNTNNANGKGGDLSGAAQSGGNNRNSIRGGGGTPSSAYSTQSNGSITVYKIN